MAKLKIVFFGLICHVGNDPDKQQGDHAVLVNSPHHEPLLLWRRKGDKPGAPPQEVPLDLQGKSIFIGSLRAKPLRYARSFQKYGVKLRDLVPAGKKTVKKNVRSRENKEDVHAYVVYPAEADELRVVKLYNKIAVHKNTCGVPLRRGPVAQLTMAVFDTDEDGVSIGYVKNRHWQELACVPSNGCILFSNAEPRGSLAEETATAGHSPHHVKEYERLTEEPIDVIVEEPCGCPPTEFAKVCTWVLKYVEDLGARASEYVDCGNGGDP